MAWGLADRQGEVNAVRLAETIRRKKSRLGTTYEHV